MSPLRLALLSLLRRKVPTLITALSIAVSVACSGILLRLYHLSASRFDSLGHGWESIVGAKAGGIEILLNAMNGEGPYPDFLPSVLYDSLKAKASVQFEDGQTATPSFIKSISPFVYFAQFKGHRAAGTDATFIEKMAPMAEGRFATSADEIVVGNEVAKSEGVNVGDTLALEAWVGEKPTRSHSVNFKVVGRLNGSGSAWDTMLFTDIENAQRVIATESEEITGHSIWGARVLHYFFVNLEPNGRAPIENLVNKRTVAQVILVRDEKAKLMQLTGAGKTIGLFVSFFVILLSTLSVSSMLITRFDAMTVQLAVLRALGRSRLQVARWLLWEGFWLGISGCVLGAVMDAVSFPILRSVLGEALPPADLVASSVFESYPIWILAMAATVFAIFIPLIRLYRQDVHQSLKV